MTEQYQRQWAADQPGCLIILLDQSGSMEDPIGQGQVGEGTRKADAAGMVVNKVLNEVVRRCTQGADVRPRVDVAVLGYGPGNSVYNALYSAMARAGSALAERDIISISDLAGNPLGIAHTSVAEFDPETGRMVETPVDIPVWIEPRAADRTPMCAALDTAYYIAYNWVMNHPDNFPPIVANITDGAATDGDPRVNAAQFAQLSTSDGAALLFNCHLSTTPSYQVKYPYDISLVPSDPDGFARQLFEMSSVLPDSMVGFARAYYYMDLYQGARGFVFGGDIADLTQFITIASLPKADR
jgi:hypothetical protein